MGDPLNPSMGADDESRVERRWKTALCALRGLMQDEATSQGSQYAISRAYQLAEIVGYEFEVPREQQCNICKKRPRLPYNPRCHACEPALAEALDKLDEAWQAASNPFEMLNTSLTQWTCEVLRAWRERKNGK